MEKAVKYREENDSPMVITGDIEINKDYHSAHITSFTTENYRIFTIITLLGAESDKKIYSQTLCGTFEEMKYSIRDNNTGAIYDIRLEATAAILNKENEKLTKFMKVNSNRTWQEWWSEKTKQNKHLIEVAEKGELDKVRDLLNIEKHEGLVANVNTRGANNYTPLHFASELGYFKVVEALIESKANVNAITNLLMTPLHLACKKGHIKIMEYLLLNYADVNVQDNEGNTPLHYLVSSGFKEAVKVYLKYKPSVTVMNVHKENPIVLAKNSRIRKLLLTALKERNPYGTNSRTIVENTISSPDKTDTVKSMLFEGNYKGFNKNSEMYPVSDIDHIKRRLPKFAETNGNAENIKLEDIKQSPAKVVEIKSGLEWFNIICMIGKGSFARVYLVRHKVTKRLFAMKTIDKEKVLKEKILRYMQAERSILSSVQSPFIVKIEAAFQNAKKLFIILEYCPG